MIRLLHTAAINVVYNRFVENLTFLLNLYVASFPDLSTRLFCILFPFVYCVILSA